MSGDDTDNVAFGLIYGYGDMTFEGIRLLDMYSASNATGSTPESTPLNTRTNSIMNRGTSAQTMNSLTLGGCLNANIGSPEMTWWRQSKVSRIWWFYSTSYFTYKEGERGVISDNKGYFPIGTILTPGLLSKNQGPGQRLDLLDG